MALKTGLSNVSIDTLSYPELGVQSLAPLTEVEIVVEKESDLLDNEQFKKDFEEHKVYWWGRFIEVTP